MYIHTRSLADRKGHRSVKCILYSFFVECIICIISPWGKLMWCPWWASTISNHGMYTATMEEVCMVLMSYVICNVNLCKCRGGRPARGPPPEILRQKFSEFNQSYEPLIQVRYLKKLRYLLNHQYDEIICFSSLLK